VEVNYVANLRPLLYKLQAAHSAKGRRIFVNQFQNYSEKAGRMVTKYVLSEKRNGRLEKLFETWQLHEAIQYLADQLK
jgi:hypothetical protein